MIPKIHDYHKDKGLGMEFDLENGIGFDTFISDKVAEKMITDLKTKLHEGKHYDISLIITKEFRLKIYLNRKSAIDLIKLVQNKLNARI